MAWWFSTAVADSFKAPEFAQQFRAFLDNAAFTKNHLPMLRANLKHVFDAGVPVVMGTDTGFYGVMMGAASQMELAATVNAARMLSREKDAGSLEAGKFADLGILDVNPLEDIRNVSRISRVVK